jgi:hypothetical protein
MHKIKIKSKMTYGGIEFIIGFILSPLSWWNDLFVNIPLSYLFALPIGLINKSLFIPGFIAVYWGINILGLILMYHGSNRMFVKKEESFKKILIKTLIWSTTYTIIIILLVVIGIIKLPMEYLT